MQKRRLQIRHSYESNRLSENFVADAYEKLIMVIKHVVEKKDNVVEEEMSQQFKRRIK